MSSKAVWELPEPRSVCHVRHDDGSVTIVRRHGNAAGPRLLLCHGNGLAIDLYYPFWSLLVDEFDLLVYDLRNHGWNGIGDRGEHNVPNLVRDQEQVIDAVSATYGDRPTIGVFHSLSALTALLSSQLSVGRTGALSAWVLFDPPLYRPGKDDPDYDALAERTAGMTRRRTHRFRKRSDFTDLLSYLPLLLRAVPGASDLMARTVLTEAPSEDGYELRCPPEYEAQVIAYIRTYAFLVDFGELPCPTKVIGSDPTLPYAYLPTFNLSHIQTVDYDFIPETTHFLQLEKPAECVATMCEFLEENRIV
ncbi:MAG: alpha/beta hydrolase [Gemmatimonadota bacterium]|nr:alpha/beta hydrolase [Gemmatimonadota bacterium]MDE2865801.1 alpha/beta hydrolase [Gemmatimonadota bacterium]